MIAITNTPSKASTGRPKISGTVLSDDGGRMCLVKCLFSGGENVGNTGSPRVEIWVALREGWLAPVVVRGWKAGKREMMWDVMRGRHELSADNLAALAKWLGKIGYAATDVWPPNGQRASAPTWPLSLWERRVILPDDRRWPKTQKSRAKTINKMLAERNECDPDYVWAIDAQILALSLR